MADREVGGGEGNRSEVNLMMLLMLRMGKRMMQGKARQGKARAQDTLESHLESN